MKWDRRARHTASFELPEAEAFVYVAWGRDESRALYVGKSRNVMSRIGQHAQASPWFPYLARLDFYGYRSEGEALQAEAEAIAELRPEYNVALNVGSEPTPTRYLRPRRKHQPFTFGERWATVDDIPADQLAIIRRIQNRGRAA